MISLFTIPRNVTSCRVFERKKKKKEMTSWINPPSPTSQKFSKEVRNKMTSLTPDLVENGNYHSETYQKKKKKKKKKKLPHDSPPASPPFFKKKKI